MSDFINIENSRSEGQKLVMEQIQEDKVCPFCPENLQKYHKNPILADGEYWIVTTNQWPYDGAKTHLLAIAKNHIENLSDINSQASSELFKLFNEVAAIRGIVGGTIAMRFEPINSYSSTVKHLHAHLIEPDIRDSNHKGVKFTISKPAQKET